MHTRKAGLQSVREMEMEFEGTTTSCKSIGNEGSKTSIAEYRKQFQMKATHFQIDNTTTLSYLAKMGGTRSKYSTELAKEI